MDRHRAERGGGCRPLHRQRAPDPSAGRKDDYLPVTGAASLLPPGRTRRGGTGRADDGAVVEPHHPPETTAPKALREARTCYDHLAGTVAVQIYDFMQAQGWLETDGSALTVYGREQFLTLGISLSTNPRRKACCACLDWSERRFHLGGEAGAALLAYLDSNGWIQRVAGYRDVVVTASGNVAIKKRFSR